MLRNGLDFCAIKMLSGTWGKAAPTACAAKIITAGSCYQLVRKLLHDALNKLRSSAQQEIIKLLCFEQFGIRKILCC